MEAVSENPTQESADAYEGIALGMWRSMPEDLGDAFCNELAGALGWVNDDCLVRATCGEGASRRRLLDGVEDILLVVSKYQVIGQLAATPGWADRVAKADHTADLVARDQLQLDTRSAAEVLERLRERMEQALARP